MTPILRELLQATAQGIEHLTPLLHERREQLSPELGAEAKKFFLDSLQARQGLDARLGAIVASHVYLAIGQREESLSSTLDVYQTFFMQAETPEDYDGARKGALSVLENADEIDSGKVGFRAAVLAGDSAFFAACSFEPERIKFSQPGRNLLSKQAKIAAAKVLMPPRLA